MIRLKWCNSFFRRHSYADAILGNMHDFIIPACHFAGSQGFEVTILNDLGWDYVSVGVETEMDAVKLRLRFPDLVLVENS